MSTRWPMAASASQWATSWSPEPAPTGSRLNPKSPTAFIAGPQCVLLSPVILRHSPQTSVRSQAGADSLVLEESL